MKRMRQKIFADFETFVDQSPLINKDVDLTPKNFEEYLKKLNVNLSFIRLNLKKKETFHRVM